MVVVLIIGILMSIAIPTFLGARRRAQDGVAKESLRTAVTAAAVASAEDMSYSAIDPSTMAAEEGALSYVDAGTPSTGPKQISIGGVDDKLGAAVMSDSGACWLATSDMRGGSNSTMSDSAKECTAKAAMGSG